MRGLGGGIWGESREVERVKESGKRSFRKGVSEGGTERRGRRGRGRERGLVREGPRGEGGGKEGRRAEGRKD